MHVFTQKQTAQIGSINNSSKSYHQRTASSEVCCFADVQKATVNRNSSDMFCVPAGCNTIHSFTLQLAEESNLEFTQPLPLPPLCTDDEGWNNKSVPHPPIPIAF